MSTLAAAVLLSAVVAGPAVNGKVPIALSFTPPPTPDPAVYAGALYSGVENSAGTNIESDLFASGDAVFTQGSATAYVPVGAGVVKLTIYGFAYTVPASDPNFNSSLVWIDKSNAISVDVGASNGHGHGHK